MVAFLELGLDSLKEFSLFCFGVIGFCDKFVNEANEMLAKAVRVHLMVKSGGVSVECTRAGENYLKRVIYSITG